MVETTTRRPTARISLQEAYATVLASRVRAQMSYRSSFWINLGNSFGIGILEFAEIYILLTNTPTLGGLTFAQAALVLFLLTIATFDRCLSRVRERPEGPMTG